MLLNADDSNIIVQMVQFECPISALFWWEKYLNLQHSSSINHDVYAIKKTKLENDWDHAPTNPQILVNFVFIITSSNQTGRGQNNLARARAFASAGIPTYKQACACKKYLVPCIHFIYGFHRVNEDEILL
jgi:hypothetical protein